MEPGSSAQILKEHEIYWRVWGILPKPTDGHWYKALSLFLHTGGWTWIICILLSLVDAKTIADFINVSILSLTFILIYIKAFCLRYNFKKIYNAFGIMHDLESKSYKNEVEQQFLCVAQKQSRNLQRIMIVICILGITMFIIQPLHNGHKLMYPSLYPFDWTTSRALYYSTFFFQAFFNYFVVGLMPSCDIYGPAMYSYIVAYIDILRYRLENLATSSPSASVRQYNLHECVKYHDTILKLCSIVDEIFSVHLFLQISLSSLIMCSTAFQFSVINPMETPVIFLFLIEYLFAMVYQLSVPCYYSSMVIFRSAELATSMYSCDWTVQTQRFKTSMMVLMERSKQPIVLKAYKKLFYITLEVFVSVMRFAYSMLTFVKSLQ